jgi:REP element-mobilizing transposase RayT
MANTFTQLTFHVVFAVWGRENVLLQPWRSELFKYTSGILTQDGMKSLAVGGWKDHIHLVFGMSPTRNLSDVVRVVKANSSKWINERRFVPGVFRWQEGYGGFTCSMSHRDSLINYVMKQEEHHSGRGFREEYLSLLREYEIEADERYVFNFIDDLT